MDVCCFLHDFYQSRINGAGLTFVIGFGQRAFHLCGTEQLIMETCYHCGDPCEETQVTFDQHSFCCAGCKMVYEILTTNDLGHYYDLQQTPGISPTHKETAFDYLDKEEIAAELLEFDDGQTAITSFLIPSIHCSSCIWVLENLSKLHPGIRSGMVNFPKKRLQLTFDPRAISLKEVVVLLHRIGYEPYISLNEMDGQQAKTDYSLIYKIGVAGFAFGNVMFLSFPEYFEVNEFWLERFKFLFRWLMFAFSVPVVVYSASDYFRSAYKGIRAGLLNIDVPIALGILTLFVRSTLEIIFDWGTGFFDSLTGLVFFLLLGKLFQQRTYSYLSFERDYKSYFPIAVTRLSTDPNSQQSIEEQVQVYRISKGDRILIRNEELIPVDAVLRKGQALIDYSFVTGEAAAVEKQAGEKVFAGGRQKGTPIELEVLNAVEQSYLTQLWSHDAFRKSGGDHFSNFTDRISRYFTKAVIAIALLAAGFWLWYEPQMAANVFTAVLIVACPCALALSAPFTLGNLIRIFGKHHFYLKEVVVIEKMAGIDTVVFDKTGTLTKRNKQLVRYEGTPLEEAELDLLGSSLRASNHPLSRTLYELLDRHEIVPLDAFEELPGKGIQVSHAGQRMRIGSAAFVNEASQIDVPKASGTSVYVQAEGAYKGRFVLRNEYREELDDIFTNLVRSKELILLSGDNESEKAYLESRLPNRVRSYFDQQPEDKMRFVAGLQDQGKQVMMVGDGLNDSGALKQSDVGIALSEDINVFTPASDAIMDARVFGMLPEFFRLSRKGMQVIRWSLIISLFYNLVGLAFAVSGLLKPVIAAILMPLSSISIVVFTTIMTQWYGRRLMKKRFPES